jgi:hypothetical protein
MAAALLALPEPLAEISASAAAVLSLGFGLSWDEVCRGAWARVPMDRIWRLPYTLGRSDLDTCHSKQVADELRLLWCPPDALVAPPLPQLSVGDRVRMSTVVDDDRQDGSPRRFVPRPQYALPLQNVDKERIANRAQNALVSSDVGVLSKKHRTRRYCFATFDPDRPGHPGAV